MISHLSRSDPPRQTPASASACPTCQSTWKDFEDTGLLGCEDCYKTFAMQLTRMLREGHDAPLHARPGRRRASDPSALLPELRSLLEQAVREEDYEKAAEVRDRIQHLEASQQSPPDEGIDPGGAL